MTFKADCSTRAQVTSRSVSPISTALLAFARQPDFSSHVFSAIDDITKREAIPEAKQLAVAKVAVVLIPQLHSTALTTDALIRLADASPRCSAAVFDMLLECVRALCDTRLAEAKALFSKVMGEQRKREFLRKLDPDIVAVLDAA